MAHVLIPVGNYPFFIHACAQNIRETSDAQPLFLVTSDVADSTLQSFAREQVEYRIAPFPYDKRGIHLRLLDWAMYNLDLGDTVYVQHCDMFWAGEGWYKSEMEGAKAVVFPYDNRYEWDFKPVRCKFVLDGQSLLRTHDFSGIYDRRFFIDNNLTFNWGKVKDIASARLLAAVDAGRIYCMSGLQLNREDFLDGSDCIGLEMAVASNCLVREAEIRCNYYHCWDLFGMGFDMMRRGSTLYVNRTLEKSMRGLHSYAWVSSHLFDKNEMRDKIFPWKMLLIHIRSTLPFPPICRFLSQYSNTNNVLGVGTNGIQRVEFKDVIWENIYVA